MYKELRKKYNLTQEQIAKVVNLATSNYNKVENGKFVLTEDRKKKLSKFYKEYSKIYEKIEKLLKKY